MEIFDRECTITGIYGDFKAIATSSLDGKTYIQSLCGEMNMVVTNACARRKFERETKPEFYNS